MSERASRRILLAFVGSLLSTLAVLSVASTATAGDTEGSVAVTNDASSYAPGDSITTTVVNATASPIAPLGGIVCQGSAWPFGVQRLDDTGDWQDVVFPRTPPCVGIAVALLGPGASQSRTITADANAGTYRTVYAYRGTSGTSQSLAVSDAFDVTTLATPQSDGAGSASTSDISIDTGIR